MNKNFKKNLLNLGSYQSIIFVIGFFIAFISPFVNLTVSNSKVLIFLLIFMSLFFAFFLIKENKEKTFLISVIFLILVLIPVITVQDNQGRFFTINLILFLAQSSNISQDLFMNLTFASKNFLTFLFPAGVLISIKSILINNDKKD